LRLESVLKSIPFKTLVILPISVLV